MSGKRPSPDGRSVDLEAVRADDALLDALGQGGDVPEDDELAAMLGAWRADLDTEPLPAFDLDLLTASAAKPVEPTGATAVRPRPVPRPKFADRRKLTDRMDGAELTDGADGAVEDVTAELPGTAGLSGPGGGGLYSSTRGRRDGAVRPRTVRLAVAAAVVIATAGGVSVAAAGGGPNSPLWPVTKIVNPQVASVREARDAIAKARAAVAAGRYGDARALIDRAAALVAKVQDPQQAAQLRAELDEIRQALPGIAPDPGTTDQSRSGTGTPATTAPAPPAPGTGSPAPGGPAVGSPVPETPSPTGRPGLLPLPLPSLPLPLPSLPHL